MLSREDFYMIKQMRQQGAYIVDIATQIGCSERTVRRYLKYPEPPARKTLILQQRRFPADTTACRNLPE
ncbi:IS21 ORF1 [Shigella sonnei]|nr:IS21 ORF1 [Shigella sonnei]